MDFSNIYQIIDDVVDFIKSFAANLKKFIDGFKNNVDFVVTTTAAADADSIDG